MTQQDKIPIQETSEAEPDAKTNRLPGLDFPLDDEGITPEQIYVDLPPWNKEEALEFLRYLREEDDPEEQRETMEYLIRVLDEDRPSYRKLFPEELKGVTW